MRLRNNDRINRHCSTHMGVLMKTVAMSKGTVLELGSGIFSTPLLHWLCENNGNELITYENHPYYLGFAQDFEDIKHKILSISDEWDTIDFNKHYGVVFIDNHPYGKRGELAVKLKDKADFIVCHDSEKMSLYGYREAFKHFKYRFDYVKEKPFTTVLSNFIDLSNF